MPPTLTIFKLSLRSILRERVAISMLGLLLLVLILLPSGLQGDGTLAGSIRMQVRYSLGFSFVLLAGMTLWVSCASISGDLSSKRLHMVVTKPVSRLSIWLGKWLSVATLITALGFLCGGVTLLRVQRLIQSADLNPTERETLQSTIITARSPHDLPKKDLSEEAVLFFEQQMESGALPPQASKEELLPKMERYLQVERFAVNPGSSATWTLPFPKPLQGGQPLQLSYHYDGLAMSSLPVKGEWILSDSGGTVLLNAPVDQTPQGGVVIPFTVPMELEGIQSLNIRFTHQDPEGAKVFFRVEHGIRIFETGGSFAFNLFRSVLLFTGLLSILAAIGVSAGSLFSLPVACYSTMVILVLQAFSGVVSEVVARGFPVHPEDIPMVMQRLTELRYFLFKGLLWLLQPMQMESPLGRVAEGVRIPLSEVMAIYGFRFIPMIGCAALVGIFFFSKREVGEAS